MLSRAAVCAVQARVALAEIYNAEDREHAPKAVTAFEADCGAK